MKTTVEPTVNISNLTEEQVEALLSGEMTWAEARIVAPGPELTVIEYAPEDVEDADVEEDNENPKA